jgi:hypothetical protein
LGLWRQVGPTSAALKKYWNEAHSSPYCRHGKMCKRGTDCTEGRRVQEFKLLYGNVLPVWSLLESETSGDRGEKEKVKSSVVRVCERASSCLVGRPWD